MSESFTSGGGRGASATASSSPPPAPNDDEIPREEVPPTTPMTRSQALARLRRGEHNAPAAVPSPPSVPNMSDLTGSERMKEGLTGDAETETLLKRSSEEDTSSQVVAPWRADTRVDDASTPLPYSNTKKASPVHVDVQDRAFAQHVPRRSRQHHRHESANTVGPSTHERRAHAAPQNDDGEEREPESELSEGTGVIHDNERGNASAVTSGSEVPRRYARRRSPLPRQEAHALPRMLALQRVFEMAAPQLYEFCSTQVLEWPSLTVEWIADRAFVDPERDYTLQYVAVGTQVHPSSGTANTVKVMEVAIPVAASHRALYGPFDDESTAEVDHALVDCVDPGKRFANVKGHFHCDQTLTVDAPVLRIRAMPAETNILAVKTTTGFIGVYNLVQEPTVNEAGRTIPDAVLRGHSCGGFGLSWNTLKPALLASASDDGYVNYYDVSHFLTIDLRETPMHDPTSSGNEVLPLDRLVGHRDIVTDCSWHSSQSHLLASSSMDGDVRLWDIRMKAGSSIISSAHPSGATMAQFHPIGSFQLATAGAEGCVRLWDFRRTATPVKELSYHGFAITGLQWSPFRETVMASCAADGRVVIWDVAKSSLPLNYSEDGLAPAEVSFVHQGHLGRVTDVSWNTSKTEEWLLASTDATNGVHFYRPQGAVVEDYRAFERG